MWPSIETRELLQTFKNPQWISYFPECDVFVQALVCQLVSQPQVVAGLNNCIDYISTNALGIRLFPQNELSGRLNNNTLQMNVCKGAVRLC